MGSIQWPPSGARPPSAFWQALGYPAHAAVATGFIIFVNLALRPVVRFINLLANAWWLALPLSKPCAPKARRQNAPPLSSAALGPSLLLNFALIINCYYGSVPLPPWISRSRSQASLLREGCKIIGRVSMSWGSRYCLFVCPQSSSASFGPRQCCGAAPRSIFRRLLAL